MHQIPPEKPLVVLVIAVGGNVSQGILKALALSDLPTRVIGTDISPQQMGLHSVDVAYVAPWANDPGFVDWCIGICKREKVDVILSGCEPVLRPLAAHRAHIEAESGAVCFVTSPEILEICDDKYNTCAWLEANGLPFPAYAAAVDAAGLEKLAQEHGFPLIAKPRRGGGSQGVMQLEDDWDLRYIARKHGYVVQEYLGNPQSEYTVGCFHDCNGALCGSMVLWRELLAGTTYRAEAGAFPEVRAAAEAIAQTLRPQGPCNIQIRMTPRGPVCFEINPRFSGTTPIRARMGFNEVDAALRHFVLGEAAPKLPEVHQGVALRYWNELYAGDEALTALEATGELRHSAETLGWVEDYGMPPA